MLINRYAVGASSMVKRKWTMSTKRPKSGWTGAVQNSMKDSTVVLSIVLRQLWRLCLVWIEDNRPPRTFWNVLFRRENYSSLQRGQNVPSKDGLCLQDFDMCRSSTWNFQIRRAGRSHETTPLQIDPNQAKWHHPLNVEKIPGGTPSFGLWKQAHRIFWVEFWPFSCR